jgi:hypothetical protein
MISAADTLANSCKTKYYALLTANEAGAQTVPQADVAAARGSVAVDKRRRCPDEESCHLGLDQESRHCAATPERPSDSVGAVLELPLHTETGISDEPCAIEVLVLALVSCNRGS